MALPVRMIDFATARRLGPVAVAARKPVVDHRREIQPRPLCGQRRDDALGRALVVVIVQDDRRVTGILGDCQLRR